jgi:hypothetical protein
MDLNTGSLRSSQPDRYNGGYQMLLRYFRTCREQTRQKQKVLHMLALSGVIRPSHIGLRYTIPLLTIEGTASSFQKKLAPPVRPSGLLQKLFDLIIKPRPGARLLARHLLNNDTIGHRKSSSTSIRLSL